MIPARILLMGSRTWDSPATIERALSEVSARIPQDRILVLVHGACPTGADYLADVMWAGWVEKWPGLFAPAEKYPANWELGKGAGPRRNTRMVNLGADVCVAFAAAFRSGTGDCARKARKAGIEVLDYGVSTAFEDKPGAAA